MTEDTMEMKSTKQIAQSADQNADIEKAVSYIRKLRSSYQRVEERKKRFDAAVAEYNRIYQASENHERFSAAWADFMCRQMSKFLTMSVRWYDPINDNFSENAPMTIFHLKEYVKEKFQDYEFQMRKESETEPDVDRFVRVCEILKKVVRVSAEDQSLLFVGSTCYEKGFELLAECQVRIGKYFSANEQERMERSWRELVELGKAIYSSLGVPAGLEKMVRCEMPPCLKRLEGVSASDRWFRFLFDGDRKHAIFNPSAITLFYSCISSRFHFFKSAFDWGGSLLVRDVFSGKSLYAQLLPLEEYFAYALTNKYKADEVADKVNARIVLIMVTMNGVLERNWERKRREYENLIDKAGYKLEDLLRGEIEVERGKFVKIRMAQQLQVTDVEKGLATGVRIGDFRVIAPIGAGAMGSVYEVEDVKLGGPHLALKFFNPKSGDLDGRLLERFKRETQILHAITDIAEPNVRLPRLRHHSLERTEYPPYYVMSYVIGKDGMPCTLLKAKERFCDDYTLEMAERWFEDVCYSLAALHKKGIVHRDIKPENILIDNDLHAVLSDFGTSKAEDGQAVGIDSTDLTIVGKFEREQVGTRRYWAPELDEGGEATPASDIYALGITFWRLLFDSEIRSSDYPPEKEAFEDFGDGWHAVMTAMLNPNPKLREQSAAHCVELLRPKPEQTHSCFKWIKMKASGLIAVLATAAVIGGFLIFGYQRRRDEVRAPDYGSEIFWSGHYTHLMMIEDSLLVCESIPRAFVGTQVGGHIRTSNAPCY